MTPVALSHFPEQFTKNVVLWVAVPQVLAEAFRVGNSRGLPLSRAPFFHRLDQVIHSVVLPEPRTLALMAIQHPSLPLDRSRNVDPERRNDWLPEGILPLQRVAVEQVRDVFEWRVNVSAVQEVLDWGGECGRSHELARLFVVQVVVVGAMREHDLWLHRVQQSNDFLECRFVVDHPQVAFLDAVIRRANCLGRRFSFTATDTCDFVRRVLGRPAIAGCHAHDMDGPAVFLVQADERAGAEKLGVVRVGEDGDGDVVRHDRFVNEKKPGVAAGLSGETTAEF